MNGLNRSQGARGTFFTTLWALNMLIIGIVNPCAETYVSNVVLVGFSLETVGDVCSPTAPMTLVLQEGL